MAPTQRQLDLIEQLLAELDGDIRDIVSSVGKEYADYKQLDPPRASELISALIEEKRISQGAR